MTPEEVIAEVITDEQADEHRYGNGCMYAPTVGEKAVAALGVAGYAIAKLPEPRFVPANDMHNEDARWEWQVSESVVSAYKNPAEVYIDSNEIDVDRARSLAAALLAAAAAAEENQ